MSKELEALNRICEHLDLDDEYFYLKNGEKTDYKIIEKSLKALEIIKDKGVNVSDFIYACKCSKKELKEYHNLDSNYELACSCVDCEKEELTQEEFDLLKEIFTNE